MPVTPSDVLFAWDAGNGIEPTVGGEPDFSRGGDKWVRSRARGGDALYTRVRGDQVPFGWADRDGVLLPRRVLQLEPGTSGHVDDSVYFASDSAWSRSDVQAEGAKESIFSGLPEGGEARQFKKGTGNHIIWQSAGTFVQGVETTSHIVERAGSSPAEFVWIALYDETNAAFEYKVQFNINTGGFTVKQGSPRAVIQRKIADVGPAGQGPVWRNIVSEGAPAGNSRRVYAVRLEGGVEDNETYRLHHCQHEQRATVTSPNLYVGSPTSRGAEDLQFSKAPEPQAMAIYTAFRPPGKEGELGAEEIWTYGSNFDDARLLHDFGNGLRFGHSDAAGNLAIVDVSPGFGADTLIETACLLYGDGSVRIVRRVDKGSAASSARSGAPADGLPASWNGDGEQYWGRTQDGVGRVQIEFLRKLAVPLSALDSATDGSENEALIDELADVPIGPHLAGHPQP